MLQKTQIIFIDSELRPERKIEEVEVIKVKEVPIYSIYRTSDKELNVFTIDGRFYTFRQRPIGYYNPHNYVITYEGDFTEYKEPTIEEILKDVIPALNKVGAFTFSLERWLENRK